MDSSVVASSLSSSVTILLLLCSQPMPNAALCIFRGVQHFCAHIQKERKNTYINNTSPATVS